MADLSKAEIIRIARRISKIEPSPKAIRRALARTKQVLIQRLKKDDLYGKSEP